MNCQIFNHIADLGIIVKGPDIKTLFLFACRAMIDLMVSGETGGKIISKDIEIEGDDYADLMVRWLGEILYLFNAENLTVNSIDILFISPNRIKSHLLLSPLDPEKQEILREIKAVTYHQISVRMIEKGWKAKVIFDI